MPVLSTEARQKLLQHNWPGNVRELDNVIQRALILHHEDEITGIDIQFEHLANEAEERAQGQEDMAPTLGDEMKYHEYNRILSVLKADHGNRQSAAEKLGISQRTLRYKLARMRELGMSVPGRYGVETA